MVDNHRFTSVSFRNYKALRKYSVALGEFNVLVGPNNAGKSTIIGAFRILAEGMRRALARRPEVISGESELGYWVPLDELPVATENVFSDYDESEPAEIEFRLSNGNTLSLIFPASNSCYMMCEAQGRRVRSPSDFRNEFRASVGFVPILGPVEHIELLYQKETARRALLSHSASRNFRNIWYHYPETFNEFRRLVQETWPGMDIERPEVGDRRGKAILHMFCPEERFPREIFWAGFGFQVWCQMLTHIVSSKTNSLLVIDEPDIYLHSDLQRQLVGILKSLGPDILIATHSTEIISESEPGDLLVIDKKSRSAKRIKDPNDLQNLFGVLGSNLNPTLTQLAKSRRVVFVEGKDFRIIAAFARKLGKDLVANRSEFAVIPVEGFNPEKVSDLSKGMELTLGDTLLTAVIFDRDYRSPAEVEDVERRLRGSVWYVHIHKRKEIENYLLEPDAMDRALRNRIVEHNRRTGKEIVLSETIEQVLDAVTGAMRTRMNAQFLARRNPSEKKNNPGLDDASIHQRLLHEFDTIWAYLPSRLDIVPGKEVLSELNKHLQECYGCTLTPTAIIAAMRREEVPQDIQSLVERLHEFANEPAPLYNK